MIPAVVCLVMLGLFPSGNAQEQYTCPVGFTLFGESCYAYMQGKMSWQDAQLTCTAIHAHLVEIYTAEDMAFVQNLSLSHGDHDIWLGGHDLVLEGAWSWAWSGVPLTYTNWGSGQPNDGDHGLEDCMELKDGNDGWNDEDCHHEKHYMCQMSATIQEEIVG